MKIFWLQIGLCISLLTSGWSAQAQICQELFKKPINYSRRSPVLRELDAFYHSLAWRTEQAYTTGSFLHHNNKLMSDFASHYYRTQQRIRTSKEMLDFYSLVGEILHHPKASIFFRNFTWTPRLQGLFNESHGRFFIRMKEVLNREQAKELSEIILSYPLLQKNNSTANQSYQPLWRLVWTTRLFFLPDLAMRDLYNLLHGGTRLDLIEDPRIRSASLDPLRDHTADLVDAFVELPPRMRRRYQNLYKWHFYVLKKTPKAMAILQKMQHAALRRMHQSLKEKSQKTQISSELAIDIVNKYWQEIGNLDLAEKGGPNPRGGYGFESVYQVAKTTQMLSREITGFIKLRPTTLFFGSFVNGIAHYRPLNSGKFEMTSDIDLTFNENMNFFNLKIRKFNGESWKAAAYVAKQSSNPLYTFMQNLEARITSSLDLDGSNSSLISPMTHMGRDQLIHESTKKSKDNDDFYITNMSPIVIEAGPKSIKLHIYLLPDGVSKASTYSFEIID